MSNFKVALGLLVGGAITYVACQNCLQNRRNRLALQRKLKMISDSKNERMRKCQCQI